MYQPGILAQQNNLAISRGGAKCAPFASASSLFSEAAATEVEVIYMLGHFWQVGLSMPDEAYLFHKQLCILSAA